MKHVGISSTGRLSLSFKVVLGSLIIKHICNLDDRETVDQISENMYMLYFLGYSGFTTEAPFDASLFVEFRKKLGHNEINAINEKIVSLKTHLEASEKDTKSSDPTEPLDKKNDEPGPENRGRVIFDATACPQDIAYPTDLGLLSNAREKSEQLIDTLYNPAVHTNKPRTYRKVARKRFLQTAQKKNKTLKVIRHVVGSQLGFLKRNLNSIN